MCRLKKHNSCCLRTVGITAQSKRKDPTPLMTNGRSLAGQRQRQAGGFCSLHPPPPPPLLPFVSLPVTVCLFVCLSIWSGGCVCLQFICSGSPSHPPGHQSRRTSAVVMVVVMVTEGEADVEQKTWWPKSPRKKRYGGHRLGVELVGWM